MARPTHIEKTAMSITRWIGSPESILVHTAIFIGSFIAAREGFVDFERMLLVLTTIVSLEAIYLAIFIQMTINMQAATIAEVEQDINEIQGDIDEIQEDVEEMQEDVEEMSEEDMKKLENHAQRTEMLTSIQNDLKKLTEDIELLRSSEPTDATPVAPIAAMKNGKKQA